MIGPEPLRKRRPNPSTANLKTPPAVFQATPTPGTGKSDQITRVVIYSARDLETEDKCFAPIGKGVTFCTTDSESCSVRSHKTGGKVRVIADCMYILFPGRNSAYCGPALMTSDLRPDEAPEDVLGEERSVSAWHGFIHARSTEDKPVIAASPNSPHGGDG